MARFSQQLTARLEDIDELGHVNNAVWVRWIQEVATAHWVAVATDAQQERYIWVVTRHEIEYRGNVAEGESVFAETWVPDPPRGARFNRHMKFTGLDSKVKVESVSTWALIERASGRLMRVPRELAEPFMIE